MIEQKRMSTKEVREFRKYIFHYIYIGQVGLTTQTQAQAQDDVT